MAKNLKLNIKNTQLAEALNLGKLKGKLKKPADDSSQVEELLTEGPPAIASGETSPTGEAEPRRVKARSKTSPIQKSDMEDSPAQPESLHASSSAETESEEDLPPRRLARKKGTHAVIESREEQETNPEQEEEKLSAWPPVEEVKESEPFAFPPAEEHENLGAPPQSSDSEEEFVEESILQEPKAPQVESPVLEHKEESKKGVIPPQRQTPPPTTPQSSVKLGPTGRHVKDLVRPKPPVAPPQDKKAAEESAKSKPPHRDRGQPPAKETQPPRGRTGETTVPAVEDDAHAKKSKVKEFTDVKPLKKQAGPRSFDSRDRQGLRENDDEQWRKKRGSKMRAVQEDVTIRPTSLKIRIPISIKDLASEMKLKSSQLVSKLFMQGVVLTLNDFLDDETTIQLIGQEFGCAIEIDTTEERRIRITDQTIHQEIESSDPSTLTLRAPVVAFMGHVDHGKTSLIDAIRKSNRVAGEAGAITQHIGAFRCSTAVGDITILDTPGHEAFSAMRARGAEVTDIVVLVVAGDEGLRQQTIEAIEQAKAANVTIVVAINKADKPNFNAENVYQQLTAHELLPETWGGSTISVNCSAVTGQGIPELLEMLALQADVLELKANPQMRARGTVIESEMHKGLGAKATILVQNGTLRLGDAVVFGFLWGRVKTMHDEHGSSLTEAGPSTPVEITGLSGLPEAGQEFIVVKNEREAREIAEARVEDQKTQNLQQKKRVTIESLVQQATTQQKKILNVILRADVQGSLEALKTSLLNIKTTKVDVNIISAGVGEVSESDIQLAAASQAIVIGFHTAIESHADTLIKQSGVKVYLHDIIYHAIDDVKRIMVELLDKIPLEKDMGTAEVRATFRSSQIGIIAGCTVTDGVVVRNHKVRVIRNGEIVWKGGIASLKRVKEDVKEVRKGFECGILLDNFSDITVGDIIQSYEVTYLTQEL